METVKAFFAPHLTSSILVVFGALVLAAGYFYYSAKISGMERDTAKQEAKTAETKFESSERLRTAQIDALQKASEDQHEREEFITENSRAISKDRVLGDGPAAPVLRNTAERLRARYKARTAARNP